MSKENTYMSFCKLERKEKLLMRTSCIWPSRYLQLFVVVLRRPLCGSAVHFTGDVARYVRVLLNSGKINPSRAWNYAVLLQFCGRAFGCAVEPSISEWLRFSAFHFWSNFVVYVSFAGK
jgi:hypothetical protein